MLRRNVNRLMVSRLSRQFYVLSDVFIPDEIKPPSYHISGLPKEVSLSDPPILKDEERLVKLRKAGKLASEMRSLAGSLVKVGVTTDEINTKVHDEIIKRGAYPSPLNYYGFPKSICTSINEQLCHGIPNSTPLKDNDCIKIDVSVFIDGVHGDCCATFFAGSGTDEARELARVCRHSVMESMKLCKPGVCITDIGNFIQDIADAHKCSVSDHFTGHGIGESLHEAPHIFHSGGLQKYISLPMEKGLVFTIEPIMCAGKAVHRTLDDMWTTETQDGSLAVQHEEMVAVTADGFELLTVEPSSSSD